MQRFFYLESVIKDIYASAEGNKVNVVYPSDDIDLSVQVLGD